MILVLDAVIAWTSFYYSPRKLHALWSRCEGETRQKHGCKMYVFYMYCSNIFAQLCVIHPVRVTADRIRVKS